MEGKETLSGSSSDSSEYESSDEDAPRRPVDPASATEEPYTALPSRCSSTTSFSEKAAVHLVELFSPSEEDSNFSDEERAGATEAPPQTTAPGDTDVSQQERRTFEEASRSHDEEEDLATLLLRDDKSIPREHSGDAEACFPCRRCPCARGLGKEEREMRWLLLCGFFFCIPWAVAMYLGLCTSRKNHKGLHQIGRLAALLWGLAWIFLIVASIVVSIILIRVTHILSEKTYGTVAFVGLMPAQTWSDANLLKHAYELGFDAVAISPPGVGATTNVTGLKDSFYNDENFLSQVLESCLDIRLNSTVVVSHSNIITRQYFFPLLMNTGLLGFVLFDSYAGEEWMTEVNPALNDHLFYSPKTRNYRYVGNRRLSEQLPRNRAGHGNKALDCVAAEFDANADDAWDAAQLRTLGPYQFFPGKYKVPGWGLRQAELLATPLDAPPDTKSSLLDLLAATGAGILSALSGTENQVDTVVEEARRVPTRRTPVEYFSPLKEVLTEFLTEIKDKIDLGTYYPERVPAAFREDRKEAYIAARVKTTLINPSTIYCLSGSSTFAPTASQESEDEGAAQEREIMPSDEFLQSAAEGLEVKPSAQPETPSLQPDTPSLRGGAGQDIITPIIASGSSSTRHKEKFPAPHGDPAGQIEYLGEVVTPVDPGKFSPFEKKRLLEVYAKRDHLRAKERSLRIFRVEHMLRTSARIH